MHIDYPFHPDNRGRTAQTTDDEHIRDLIEQVLFTAPGERVNRPDFGSGLMQLVFGPNSDELATATQFMVAATMAGRPDPGRSGAGRERRRNPDGDGPVRRPAQPAAPGDGVYARGVR